MNRLTLFLATALAIAIAIIFIRGANNDRLNSDNESLRNMHAMMADSAEYWRDESGKARASEAVALTNLETAKEMMPRELEALRRDISGLKRNLSNLESVTAAGITSRGTISGSVRDTTIINNNIERRSKTFTYGDKWIWVNGLISDSTFDLQYKYEDSMVFTTYWKKEGLFKKRVLTLDAISYNPNSTISGIKNIRIATPKRRKPRIGVYLGYGIGRNGLSPQVGVGMVY
jgi:hypothetical protein